MWHKLMSVSLKACTERMSCRTLGKQLKDFEQFEIECD